MITKRKKYVKPMIGIIVSKRRMRLLVGSGDEGKSKSQDYDYGDKKEW